MVIPILPYFVATVVTLMIQSGSSARHPSDDGCYCYLRFSTVFRNIGGHTDDPERQLRRDIRLTTDATVTYGLVLYFVTSVVTPMIQSGSYDS